MLKGTQIISNVIKPMMSDRKIKKCGFVKNKNDYKKDSYEINSGK